MSKSNLYLSIIYIAAAIFCMSFASCKTPSAVETKNTKARKSDNKNSEGSDLVITEDSGISLVYLMVRLLKQNDAAPLIIGVERSISKKQGNPLPVPGSHGGTDAFKCVLIGTDGSTISTNTQNASFEYGEGKNEAILKFILPAADEIQKAIVSYQTKEGDWEVLLEEEMKEE